MGQQGARRSGFAEVTAIERGIGRWPSPRTASPEDQDVGVDVRSVGPHDGAQLFVHPDGPKEGCVLPNGPEHMTVQVRPKSTSRVEPLVRERGALGSPRAGRRHEF